VEASRKEGVCQDLEASVGPAMPAPGIKIVAFDRGEDIVERRRWVSASLVSVAAYAYKSGPIWPEP